MNKKEYQKNIIKAMEMLGKDKQTIFLGQTVEYPGSPMYPSLKKVPMKKRIEFPVAENTQIGLSLGMALEGFIPVSIFPRIDFLICATDQLVNHLDKTEEMSNGEFKPGVIIRTQIGNKHPLYPGPQHCQNHYSALKKMCPNINVVKLDEPSDIIYEYKKALKLAKQGKSSLLIEVPTGAFLE